VKLHGQNFEGQSCTEPKLASNKHLEWDVCIGIIAALTAPKTNNKDANMAGHTTRNKPRHHLSLTLFIILFIQRHVKL
jgi:hypothetical protein